MNVKKEYNVEDIVWIHGISSSNKLTQGKIIGQVDLSERGYSEVQYIVEIPTHIEPLLELRTWHTISQDEKGPVGSLRSIADMMPSNNKKMRHVGYVSDYNDDEDPTPEEIMAALEKSADGLTHKPLHIKETKPKRRYYPKKKK